MINTYTNDPICEKRKVTQLSIARNGFSFDGISQLIFFSFNNKK